MSSCSSKFMDEAFGDRVAKISIEKFNSLGKSGKPVTGKEWTVLAAIVKVEIGIGSTSDESFEVVSLGTGSKCLGGKQLPQNGDRLHDSHAEVVSRRAFKVYLLNEIAYLINGKESIFYMDEGGQISLRNSVSFHFYCSNTPCGDASIFPTDDYVFYENRKEEVGTSVRLDETSSSFKLNSLGDVEQCPPKNPGNHSQDHKLLMEYPVRNVNISNSKLQGNISFPKRMSPYQIREDYIESQSESSTKRFKFGTVDYYLDDEVNFLGLPVGNFHRDLHRTGAKCVLKELEDSREPGLNYHVTGVLRTKPGRGDPTLSHCCSDKIFKWLVLGIQGSFLMLFLKNPIYISSITIGRCVFNYEAFERAVSTRFKEALSESSIPEPFGLRPPKILCSNTDFIFKKPHSCKNSNSSLTPSSSSVIWSKSPHHMHKPEVSVDGKRIGSTKKNANSPKSRVSICRSEIFRFVLEILSKMNEKNVFNLHFHNSQLLNYEHDSQMRNITYGDLKKASIRYITACVALHEKVLSKWTLKPPELVDFKLQ